MAFQRSHKLNLLRLAVLLIVTLAGIKFLLRDSFPLQSPKPGIQDSFWGPAQAAEPRSGALETVAAEEPDERQQLPQDEGGPQLRLVHLDLKGAAPRVSYLEQLFPLLSQLGASGILVEYEDMFPFQGELETLRSPYAYSEEDVERIQQLAELNQLEVVPLVQTFGHAEFILKHEKFQHLREVERFPNSFNPHAPGTLPLLRNLLAQVMEKHGRSSWIHIGADEVFHLGEGADSRAWMSRTKGDVGAMYLQHVKEVASAVAAPGRRALMWDDMLRRMSAGALRESGLAELVSPVVWFYAPDFDAGHVGPFLAKYAESGFGSVWFASAFKGTTGPAQAWPPLGHHLQNQLSWLKVVEAMPRFAPLRLQGIVLTGWQRYDHYAVLCELLPVGIPSLAVCLQTLANGGFTEATKRKVLDVLGFHSIQLEQSTCEGNGAFPGAQIYRLVEQVNGHLKESVAKILEEESAVKGWFSPYHRKRRFGNPRNLESFGSRLLKLHEDWQSVERSLRAQLASVYFPDAVDEWLEENVSPYLEPLRELLRDYRAVIRLNGRPKAPGAPHAPAAP
ncbi:hexosaminidase D-like [Nothoprocta perdicaria]|uniref:hexosaminidase D-like n=1 Tax=Nothoprocta perdicaria TaxID=30464 RepID=UPI000E1BD470|nr:hexosaminidase D-like [Nothoprocta perdicaria]